MPSNPPNKKTRKDPHKHKLLRRLATAAVEAAVRSASTQSVATVFELARWWITRK